MRKGFVAVIKKAPRGAGSKLRSFPPTVNANWGGLARYRDLANDLAIGVPGDDAAAFVAMVIPGQFARRTLGNGMSGRIVGKVFAVCTPNRDAVFDAEIIPGHDGTMDTHGSLPSIQRPTLPNGPPHYSSSSCCCCCCDVDGGGVGVQVN